MSDAVNWPFLPSKSRTELSHARGSYLYLKNGKKVLDAAGGAIVCNIGHGREVVAEAIHKAVLNASYVVPGWLTPEREALVNELRSHWLPDHLTNMHLTCSGSEGNEAAMKIAALYHAANGHPEKNVFLARDVSYHGTTISTAAISGHPARQQGLEHILQDYPRIETPYPLRCPLGSFHPEATDYYLKNLTSTIERIGPERIAALVAEPMNGSSGGAISPPDDYWPKAQAILQQHDILLIMDEVMTGFGRTGSRFGAERFGVDADLMVSGKGLAGGYAAITGVFGRMNIAETIQQAGYGLMFHTFSALPQSCAAAIEVLRILREEDLLHQCRSLGATLKQQLTDRLGQHPLVAEIRGEGLLIALEIVRDRETLEPFPLADNIGQKIVNDALRRGVFFYPGGTGEVRDIVCIGAPYIIGETEITLMVDVMEQALNGILDKV